MNRLVLAFFTSTLLGLASIEAHAADYIVVIDDMAFTTLPQEAKVGDTIVWKNDDIFRHSATAGDGSFDLDLPAGSEVRMELDAAGTFDFFCRFHPGMTGVLVVAP